MQMSIPEDTHTVSLVTRDRDHLQRRRVAPPELVQCGRIEMHPISFGLQTFRRDESHRPVTLRNPSMNLINLGPRFTPFHTFKLAQLSH